MLRNGGRVSDLIVPMSLLGDDQSVGVRKIAADEHRASQTIEAFPQKDDPKRRGVRGCETQYVRLRHGQDDGRHAVFRARVHPGSRTSKRSRHRSPFAGMMVKLYDPENQPIVACSQEDWDLAVRIMSSGRMRRLGDCCVAYQGEVNETTDGKKGNISYDEKDGQLHPSWVEHLSVRAQGKSHRSRTNSSTYGKGDCS